MAEELQNQVLGSGKLMFDPFKRGTRTPTGLAYFGNTPEFSLNNTTTAVDHYDSDNGPRVKDKSVDVSSESRGSFTCDNINMFNLALFFMGDVVKQTNAALTAEEDSIPDVIRGRFYQLGKSEAQPQGAMFVDNVVVKKGVTTIAAENYTVDLELGLLGIHHDAPGITDGDDLTVTYDVDAGVQDVVISKGTPAYGELKFNSKNYEGTQKDYTAPYCKISPNGDLALKGEDWQTVSFSVEFLKLNATTERLYVRHRGN